MKRSLVVLVAVSSLARAEPVRVDPRVPWIENFDDVVAATSADRTSVVPPDAIWEIDPTCVGAAYGGLRLSVNLGAAITLGASYARGVTLANAEGQTIATAPGYPCYGSADEVDAIAVGRSWGTPVIALVLTTGGRRETMTWVGFYRVGLHGTLEPTFSGAVEQYKDGNVRRGSITLLPGALIHRNPTGETVLWVYHPIIGVYVPYSLQRDPHVRSLEEAGTRSRPASSSR